MKFKIIIIFLLTPLFCISQSLNQRRLTENSFVVLKNSKEVLPFKNFDKSTIKVISNCYQSRILNQSIIRYDDTSNLKQANVLILPILNENDLDYNSIVEKKKNYHLILCFFGVSDVEKYSSLTDMADAIIYTSLSDSLTIDYCGQLLFGAFSVNNKLQNTLSSRFTKGAGLQLIGDIRFKYTIPAEVGLDSALLFSKVDSIINYAISIGATPGCQVFAAIDKKVFINKSYGFKTYDSLSPINNFDLYDLASITKVAASAPALMYLCDQKKFEVKYKFSKYLKSFKNSNKKDLTFIDAYTHQGQLIPYIPFWKSYVDKRNNLNPNEFSKIKTKKFSIQVADSLFVNKKVEDDIFKGIVNSTLLKEKKYKYSDLSFYYTPQIVRKITHKDLETFLDEYFYKKLGANSFCFNPLRFYSKNLIVPSEYDSLFRKQLLWGYVDDEGAAMLGGVSGHAGLFANANDLAKLFQMYLDYGVYGGEKYLDSTTVKQWTSVQFAENDNHRGIVFDKTLLENREKQTASPLASDESFGHTGFTGTFVWADPKYKFLFVFLSNRIYPTRNNTKLLQQNIRTNIHTEIYNEIIKSKQ